MQLRKPSRFAALCAIGSSLILLSCTNLIPKTPGLGTQTGKIKPAACSIFQPITDNRGKPGKIAVEDIASILDRDDPVARARNLLGDTMKTRAQIAEHNAVWRCHCEDKCDVAVAH